MGVDPSVTFMGFTLIIKLDIIYAYYFPQLGW